MYERIDGWINRPMRVFSCPLNQDTSAAGLAWTWHLITTASPSAAYCVESPKNVIGTREEKMFQLMSMRKKDSTYLWLLVEMFFDFVDRNYQHQDIPMYLLTKTIIQTMKRTSTELIPWSSVVKFRILNRISFSCRSIVTLGGRSSNVID